MTAATFNVAMADRQYDSVMEKLMADNALFASSDLDDVYEICKKHVHMTKAEFIKYADYCKAIMEDDGSSRRELTELELEMVAGGNWFTSACSWVKNKVVSAYNTVKNFVVDRWNNGGVFGKIAIIGIGVAAVAAVAAGIAYAAGGVTVDGILESAAEVASSGAVICKERIPFSLCHEDEY